MMIRSVVVSTLILVLSWHLAYSRSIRTGSADGHSRDFLEWASSETCEPSYGFLPCSSNVWGLVFLIVMYNILLSIGGQYIATGSNLFFEIIGPGVVGGSIFQFLGTIPHLVMLLVPSLTSSTAQAQARASSGMGMVLGGVAMSLTLLWGLTIVLGSYELTEDATTNDTSESQKPVTVKGSSVVTDVETSWTARLVLVGTVPFLIIELQNAVTSSSWRRVIILIALIVTVLLLCAYMLYQSFQPWIQNRCFEYIIDKHAKDKLLKLVSTNGRPDTRKIQRLFNKIDKDNNASVTAREIRVLVLGVNIDDDETSVNLALDNITTYFDTSGDGGINQDEFITGMTRLASNLLDQTPTQITNGGNNNSQITSQDQQPLLASSTSMSKTQRATNSWSIYLRATFFLVFGTVIASALSEPLVKSVIQLASAANISSFCISYVVLPVALGYNRIIQTIASATQKTQKSNSLTLSSVYILPNYHKIIYFQYTASTSYLYIINQLAEISRFFEQLYGGVFMNNLIGLVPLLVPVYIRNLSLDSPAELILVLLICTVMGIYTSFNTTFPRWTGYIAVLLYPLSLATVYVLTSVLGWS